MSRLVEDPRFQEAVDTRAFVRSLLGGPGWEGALARQVDPMRGFEEELFLPGARNFPLVSVLARPLLSMAKFDGVTPESVADSVEVVLGICQGDPMTFKLAPLTQGAVAALHGLATVSDGEEFFWDGRGKGCRGFWRVFRVESGDPEAVASAWGVETSAWSEHGVIQFAMTFDEGPGRLPRIEPEVVTRWGAHTFDGRIGCERVDLQMGVLPAGAPQLHPLREQAIKEGLMRPEQHLIVLNLWPVLEGLGWPWSGPAANHTRATEGEQVLRSCNTHYTFTSRMASYRAHDVVEGLRDADDLASVAANLMPALGPLTQKAWVGPDPLEHVPGLSESVSDYLAGSLIGLVTQEPEDGHRVVEMAARQSERLGLHTWFVGEVLDDGRPVIKLGSRESGSKREEFLNVFPPGEATASPLPNPEEP